MADIFLLSLVAAANATLLAAVTVMLFLPNPKRLLLGYLAGAMLTSLSIGFVIVFALEDSGATSTARNSMAPSMDITLGLLFLLVAYVLRGGHDERLRARRAAKKAKPELLILLEVPLLGYYLAPERTVVEVQRFRAWLTRSGRSMAIYGFAGLGALLVIRGVIGFLT